MAGRATVTMPVTSTLGEYATQVAYLREGGISVPDDVAEVTVAVESLPPDATVQVDLLRPGASVTSTLDADWILGVQAYTAVGLQAALSLANWKGVRLRAKSGGTAGDVIVSLSWW